MFKMACFSVSVKTKIVVEGHMVVLPIFALKQHQFIIGNTTLLFDYVTCVLQYPHFAYKPRGTMFVNCIVTI